MKDDELFWSFMAQDILRILEEAKMPKAYIEEKRERLRGLSYSETYLWAIGNLDASNQKRLAYHLGVSWNDWKHARQTMIQIFG